MNCNRCGFPITPEFPAMIRCNDLHAGGGTCIRAQQAEIERLKERTREIEAAMSKTPAQWCLEERADGNGGCGACSICCAELRAENERLRDALHKTIRIWVEQDNALEAARAMYDVAEAALGT
jgi:hypothetical protein